MAYLSRSMFVDVGVTFTHWKDETAGLWSIMWYEERCFALVAMAKEAEYSKSVRYMPSRQRNLEWPSLFRVVTIREVGGNFLGKSLLVHCGAVGS